MRNPRVETLSVVELKPILTDRVPEVISDVRLGQWNGQPPRAEPGGPRIELQNGDGATGEVEELHEGTLRMKSPSGPLEIPLQTVQSIVFSEDLQAAQAAARLRLTDGSVIHLETFHWDGKTLTGRSKNLGEVRIPAGALEELIQYPPSLRRPPRTGDGQKRARRKRSYTKARRSRVTGSVNLLACEICGSIFPSANCAD